MSTSISVHPLDMYVYNVYNYIYSNIVCVYIYYRFICIIDLYSIVKRSILWCTVSYLHLHCFPDVFPSGVGFPRHSLGLTVIVWTITIAVYPCQAVRKKCQPCKFIGHCIIHMIFGDIPPVALVILLPILLRKTRTFHPWIMEPGDGTQSYVKNIPRGYNPFMCVYIPIYVYIYVYIYR